MDDSGRIELKPLNLLVGANSAGKSSFLKFFPILKQSLLGMRQGTFSWYGSYVDFKDFKTTLRDGASEMSIEFVLEGVPLLYKNAAKDVFFERMYVSMDLGEKSGNDYLKKLYITWKDNSIQIEFSKSSKVKSIYINTNRVAFPHEEVIASETNSLFPKIIFHNKRDGSNALESGGVENALKSSFKKNKINKGFDDADLVKMIVDNPGAIINCLGGDQSVLTNYLYYHCNTIIDSVNVALLNISNRITYIMPLRAFAKRDYRIQNYSVNEIDADGTNLPMFLHSLRINNSLSKLNGWLKGVFGMEIIMPKSSSGHVEIELIHNEAKPRNIVDIGFGYSQLLPILVMIWKSLYMPNERTFYTNRYLASSIIAIEQPELHLHPRFQVLFAKAVCEIIKKCEEEGKRVSFIMETHSESIINAVGEYVGSSPEFREKANVVLFNAKSEGMEKCVEIANYDEDGYLTNWPIGFFAR